MHLIVIGGPTATGKTAMAASLAHRLDADVISADSRQVYRGLDLGTGKDLDEFRKFTPPVRHHLIDIVEPGEIYSLYRFQQDCYGLLEKLEKGQLEKEQPEKSGPGRRDTAILVGGTGMYIESVLRRYRIANVTENAELREALASRDQEDLARELREKDPDLAERTDLTSRKRIIRALIIHAAGEAGGAPVEYSPLPAIDFSYTVFAPAWDRSELRERIGRRLEDRLQAGMIEEVAGLMRQGVAAERLRLLGMEYREITDYLTGLKDKVRMVEDLRHEIHLLAKRQETYFRGMERRGIPIRWLARGEGAETILQVLSDAGVNLG